jgi:sulfur-carrier protein adenylyltransferase/sulfurtransferase
MMRWKQFFTPVDSLDAPEAKKFMNKLTPDQFTLLDVRQPAEYQSGHLPGAKLIPLMDLNQRIAEIDPTKPTLVYCAVGGRSRVAAQMLAGQGFTQVINMAGGIKAWNSNKAIGPEDLGLDLFSGKETPREALIVAYSLEEGLKEFYVSMIPEVKNDHARQLFQKLATIEVKHQDRIFAEYCKITGTTVNRDEFEREVVVPAMEGGLTTEEYLKLYEPDLEVVEEVISLAMAIEAQALDLYHRAAERAASSESREALLQIANEERAHLEQLGKLFEGL